MDQPIKCELSYEEAQEVYETTQSNYELVDALEAGLKFLDDNEDQPSITILLTVKR